MVCGPCTAGGAYVPVMSDEAIIVKGTGSLYLGGPLLVKVSSQLANIHPLRSKIAKTEGLNVV